MPTASYHHLGSSPVTTSGGLTCSVCLYVAFADVPAGKDGSPINDPGLTFSGQYRAQPWEEPDENGLYYSFVLEGSDGSTDIERAHKGATNVIKQIAQGRGFSLTYDDIAYQPA